MRFLIVNADDFGRFEGVSRGIIDAHLKGIVTSTTVMMNCEDAPSSLEMALKAAPALGLGVHLNLTYGKPISGPDKVRTLVSETGYFRNPNEAVPVFLAWREDEIQLELTAQIERFIQLTGFMPTHLDSHYHSAFLFSNALGVALELAKKYKIPMRRPPSLEPLGKAANILLQCFPNTPFSSARGIILKSKSVLEGSTGVEWPDYLELGFSRPNISLEALQIILNNLSPGITELMCHPAYVGSNANDQYRNEREKEVVILSNAQIKNTIEGGGIERIRFSCLPKLLLERQGDC